MAFSIRSCLLLFASVAWAQIPGVNFTLPWGTWEASSYDAVSDYYAFSDIRFAKSPTGELRFQRPEAPDPIDDPNTIIKGPTRVSCFQVNPNLPCTPGGNGRSIGYDPAPVYELEDCLFFDLYVPRTVYEAAKANGTTNAPVIMWIYGGAYVFGKKNDFTELTPFYNGTAAIQIASQFGQEAIYIAGNYRLGALGWLAGETMQKEAQPNAGLYDQRLLMEVIEFFVDQVGGNGQDITVWGESAGAGSILHHLVADWGSAGPGFKKALLESPAYQWAWDVDGGLETSFSNFSKIAECNNATNQIECLQQVNSSDIYDYNQLFYSSYTPCTGLFNSGPAVDGSLIKRLPPVSFLLRKYSFFTSRSPSIANSSACGYIPRFMFEALTDFFQPGDYYLIDSMIVSHVDNEAVNFVPKWVQTPSDFNEFVDLFFSDAELEPVRELVLEQYPASGPPYNGNQQLRLRALIQDAVFTCNTRQLYNAYKPTNTQVYMEQFSINTTILPTGAFHSLDVLPTFKNQQWDPTNYLISLNIPGINQTTAPKVSFVLGLFSPLYQSYYVSHATTGSPNSFIGATGLPEWNVATDDGNYVTDVMNAGIISPDPLTFFNNSFTDTINTADACDFWDQMAFIIDSLGVANAAKGKTSPNKDFLHFGAGKARFRAGDQTVIPEEL